MRIILLKQKAHRWNLSTWLWPDKCRRAKNMQSTRTHMNFMEISDHSVKQWNSENQFKPDGYKIKITCPVKAFEKLKLKKIWKKKKSLNTCIGDRYFVLPHVTTRGTMSDSVSFLLPFCIYTFVVPFEDNFCSWLYFVESYFA